MLRTSTRSLCVLPPSLRPHSRSTSSNSSSSLPTQLRKCSACSPTQFPIESHQESAALSHITHWPPSTRATMTCSRSLRSHRCNRGDLGSRSLRWSRWWKRRSWSRCCSSAGRHSKRNYMKSWRSNSFSYASTWRKIIVMKVVKAMMLILTFFHLRTSKFSS